LQGFGKILCGFGKIFNFFKYEIPLQNILFTVQSTIPTISIDPTRPRKKYLLIASKATGQKSSNICRTQTIIRFQNKTVMSLRSSTSRKSEKKKKSFVMENKS
jgi:hypothetical protein